MVVIGGGPAGLAAATAAAEEGTDVLLVDRNFQLGGILNQCIHDGFGLHAFGEILTGPEFADRFVQRARHAGVKTRTNTLVTDLTADHEVICTSRGCRDRIKARSVILAMGCRERTRGMIRIPGNRPAGVYTAGTAQRLTNMTNIRIGERIVILGSGDIGLIMARRLTWEGAKVIAVIEKLPYPSGLARNITQCLEDYDIPLHLSHSVIYVHGRDRVEAVTVAQMDERGASVPGSEFNLGCDTLLLSVGLIPENDLSRRVGVALDSTTSGASIDNQYMTNVPGIFSCGNVLHIHDLADWAADEGERAGRSAARYTLRKLDPPDQEHRISINPGPGIRYVVPQTAGRSTDRLLVSFRVSEPGQNTTVRIMASDSVVATKKLRKSHPATMVQMEIDSDRLFDADSVEVRIS